MWISSKFDLNAGRMLIAGLLNADILLVIGILCPSTYQW